MGSSVKAKLTSITSFFVLIGFGFLKLSYRWYQSLIEFDTAHSEYDHICYLIYSRMDYNRNTRHFMLARFAKII